YVIQFHLPPPAVSPPQPRTPPGRPSGLASNHHDVTPSWSGPRRCDTVVVSPRGPTGTAVLKAAGGARQPDGAKLRPAPPPPPAPPAPRVPRPAPPAPRPPPPPPPPAPPAPPRPSPAALAPAR